MSIKAEAGVRVGHLTLISFEGKTWNYVPLWKCRCDCGVVKVFQLNNISSRFNGACGHNRNSSWLVTHGKSHSAEYRTWGHMMNRCYNKRDAKYSYHGGRGIRVCRRWRRFENFLNDMGPRPAGTSLDRKKNNLGYSLGNCWWATPTEQSNNRRNNVFVSFDGKKMSIAEWALKTGIKPSTIYCRLNLYGWSIKRALSEKPRRWRN